MFCITIEFNGKIIMNHTIPGKKVSLGYMLTVKAQISLYFQTA